MNVMESKTGDLVKCDGCEEDGFLFGDEVFLYELPDGEGSMMVPLCLNCGPEENYEDLA